jgi:hypothetical protein
MLQASLILVQNVAVKKIVYLIFESLDFFYKVLDTAHVQKISTFS